MLCLLLFSLLVIAQAQVNFTHELSADLAVAFQNVGLDPNASVNLTALNSFDAFVADAEQDFNKAASLTSEDIEWALQDFLNNHRSPAAY
jgi:hypothetical protein